MSPNIWTLCGARSNLRALRARPWRVVEAQHLVSTRKLVDSDDEQEVLEAILDDAKPAAPAPALHFLLTTPFRYPPLPHGSRFGSRGQRGIWYGSEGRRTALAETSYYRLLFVDGTDAPLTPLHLTLTLFRARVASRRAVDLGAPPFDGHRELIASPTDYAATQELGRAMREDGVELCRYPSARDAAGGSNVAVFVPKAFATPTPEDSHTWSCVVERDRVELRRADLVMDERLVFPRRQFEVGGALPGPAV